MFKYTPLPIASGKSPIRLLKLFPATAFTEHIRCELFDACIEGKVEFEALSYTWGDPTDVIPIFLHDHEHLVTKNLKSALQHLRDAREPRVLWVDALCINQRDDEEKSHQLRLMRKIYDTGGARRVVIWLGEEENARLAFDFCDKLRDSKNNHFATQSDYDAEWEACHDLFSRKWWSRSWIIQEAVHANEALVYIGKLDPKPLEEICDMYSRYRSLLLVRETYSAQALRVSNSQNVSADDNPPTAPPVKRGLLLHILLLFVALPVYCVSNVPWLRLTTVNILHILCNTFPRLHKLMFGSRVFLEVVPAAKNWNTWLRTAGYVTDPVSEIMEFRAKALNPSSDNVIGYPPPLAGLIRGFAGQDATDPRDKVWAFIGMAIQDYDEEKIPIDCSKTKEVLYTNVARAFFRKVLIPLLWVESPTRPVSPDSVLPSWVPDYTTKQGLVPKAFVSTIFHFSADRSFPTVTQEPRSNDHRDCEVLVLRGIYVAVITGTLEARMTQDDDLLGLDQFKLVRYDRESCNRGRDFVKDPPSLWRTHDEKSNSPLISHTNASWGPLHSEIGDIVIIAAGSRIPLVLRKFADGKYLFVGACWLIDGEIEDVTKLEENAGFSSLMFGSACEGLPDDYEPELFHIY